MWVPAFGEARTSTMAKPTREETIMRRRDLLKAVGASVTALAAPWIGRAEKASKLVFVTTEDLNVLDPVIGGPRSMRTHSYLVFDTLYGIDTAGRRGRRWSRGIRSKRTGSAGI